MKAKDGVLELLNQVLRAELTAVHQYLLHAALCKNWGYSRLHEHYSHLAQEEVGHSSGLMDHVLYLDGTPDVEHLDAVAHGKQVDRTPRPIPRLRQPSLQPVQEPVHGATLGCAPFGLQQRMSAGGVRTLGRASCEPDRRRRVRPPAVGGLAPGDPGRPWH